MAKKTLDRAAILGKTTLQTEMVDVPEWGGQVEVRELTGAERDAWEGGFLAPGTQDVKDDFMVNARARLVVLAAIDDDGNQLFTADDMEALGQLSGAALSRVFFVATRLSGLNKDDLDELEKNLKGGTAADSGSL